MATPAQIANDMTAHATFWAKRGDDRVAKACREAAAQIRDELDGVGADWRSWNHLNRTLLELATDENARHYQGYPNFTRARLCLEELRRGNAK
ncbi:hypothetical protein [Sagittula sp. S175]|uniref:hypothetical protein n=1 Tax=Sagittula sp. S175 TaxID=3415129 RepID=UPI003C7E162C